MAPSSVVYQALLASGRSSATRYQPGANPSQPGGGRLLAARISSHECAPITDGSRCVDITQRHASAATGRPGARRSHDRAAANACGVD